MTKDKAIFDNTTYNIFARIKSEDLLLLSKNIFNKVYVPLEIQREIANFPIEIDATTQLKMVQYSDKIAEGNFLTPCTSYDNFVKSFLGTIEGIDNGEAEAIAQSINLYIGIIFTDDIRFIKALPKSYSTMLRLYPTYFIIFLLDILGYIQNYEQIIKEYFEYKPPPKNKYKEFSKEFRNNYNEAIRYYGLTIDKKTLNSKTQISKFIK